MINKELFLNVAGVDVSVFMQDNFFDHKSYASPIHRHKYPELHVCFSGTSLFYTDGDTLKLEAGELLVIPSGVYHKTDNEPEVERASFQVSLPLERVSKHHLLPGQAKALLIEIENHKTTGEAVRLSAVLSGIISHLIKKPEYTMGDITDRSFLIHEFLLYNYNKQITLSDLAKELNLSEKQTARSVRTCLGTSFSEELIKRRMEAAKHLRQTTNISLQDIASQVGYLSYSGFWKAFSAYAEKEKT